MAILRSNQAIKNIPWRDIGFGAIGTASWALQGAAAGFLVGAIGGNGNKWRDTKIGAGIGAGTGAALNAAYYMARRVGR